MGWTKGCPQTFWIVGGTTCFVCPLLPVCINGFIRMCTDFLRFKVYQNELLLLQNMWLNDRNCLWDMKCHQRLGLCPFYRYATFFAPDLRLIHGWRVTTSWVRRPLWVTQLGQLSLPSLRGRQMSSDPCNLHGLRSSRPLNGRLGRGIAVSHRPGPVGTGVAYSLYSVLLSVSDDSVLEDDCFIKIRYKKSLSLSLLNSLSLTFKIINEPCEQRRWFAENIKHKAHSTWSKFIV